MALSLKGLSQRRALSYALAAAAALPGYALVRTSPWQGSGGLGTLLEALATDLALTVAILALIYFYHRPSHDFLCVGVAFLGVAALDGYGALGAFLATTAASASDMQVRDQWGWILSSTYLSLVLCWRWLAALLAAHRADGRQPRAEIVLAVAGVFILGAFALLAFAPLRSAYLPGLSVPRPLEAVPALLFAIALAGHLRRGAWREDSFEHWLVLALVIGAVAQFAVMPFSGHAHDSAFVAAHVLMLASYASVLVGMLVTYHSTFGRMDAKADRLLRTRAELRTQLGDRQRIEQVLSQAKAEFELQFKERSKELSATLRKLEIEVSLRVIEHGRFAALLESAPDAMIVFTDDGLIDQVNARTEEMFDYLRQELLGKPVAMLLSEEFRIPRAASRDTYAPTLDEGEELTGRARDGASFPMEVRVTPIETGSGSFFVATVRDLTARRRAADVLASYTQELERSNVALRQFAYAASHDLQEPLRKVIAFSDRLNVKYASLLDAQGRDYIARMQAAAVRMRSLIDGLLEFSRISTQGQPPVTRVELGQIVREVAADLEERIREAGAKIEISELPAIDADPLQMRQLFQNLMGNALKFRRKDARPVIEVSSQVVPSLRSSSEGEPPSSCRIFVKDNGIGFAPEHAERIFEAFKRLHSRDEYEGTGVGLAICRKIAERHGGSIEVTARPGEGATFVVTLPMTHAAGNEVAYVH